jgi:IPT/TIG domain
MRRITITSLTLIAAALLVVPATAGAAQKRSHAPTPQITRVQPMRVAVGGTVTVTGRNFKAQRGKNTLIFRASNGRTAFAKPKRATRTKLVVRVPAAVARLLNVAHSSQRPTRLRLVVLAGRFSKITPRRLSPVVTGVGDGSGGPGGPGGTQTVCNSDSDHDNDLLPNSLELAIGTDPCLADTDADQMSDGWEYYSAKDLNVKAVPYPGTRPFPNALDPSDGGRAGATSSAIDFDGDGLTSLEEYRAWRYTGSAFDPSKAAGLDLESPLGYSDGTKYSRINEVPGVPAWRGPAYGLPAPAEPFPATYDHKQDPAWHDDERDADGDGLANWLEAARGPGQPVWWQGFFASLAHKAEPWGQKTATTCGQDFGYYHERPFAELDLANPDVDGDTLLDGEDDQDNDDVTNIRELYEAVYDLDADSGFSCAGLTYPSVDMDPTVGVDRWGINPFNPCAPNPNSRTCPEYKPF